MISVDYVRTMVAYGQWMNSRLLDVAATLPMADRTRDMGAFFKSIHGTLDHVLWADLIWMSRFDGGAPPVPASADFFSQDWDDLRRRRTEADTRMQQWAENEITDEWLAAPLNWVTRFNPARWSLPGWVAVTHMFNHGTHHRGQATTLMMQSGVDPGVTDLPALPGLFDGSLGIAGVRAPL